LAVSPSEQKQVGKYTVLRTLGRGGAGVVYECLDPDLDRSVAIKTLLPAEDAEGEEHLRRFKTEAQALARLAHQNIVRIYDYDDRTEDFPFIVMEFVEGGSLRQVLDPAHPMPPAQAVGLVRQVLAGLAATHRIGVIHRDIKPGNILMRGDEALIADFGIARIADKRSTMVGTVIGTAHYMAPEQLLGGEIDARADIWSTGVLLYQALTGRQPFDGSNALVIMEAIRNTTPRPPSEHVSDGSISGVLDQVVLKSLAKRPEDRFASADDFARALDEAMKAPSEVDRTIVMAPPTGSAATLPASGGSARPAPRGTPAKSSAMPWIVGGGGAAVLAGIGVTVWMLASTPTPVPVQRPVEPPPPAVTARVEPPAMVAPAPAVLPPTPPPTPQPADPPPVVTSPVPQPPIAQPPVVPPAAPVVVPPASPPPQAITEPPPPPPTPAPPPGPRLADLRGLVDTAECAVIGGSLEPGRMVLNGLGAVDVVDPLRAVWSALRAADPPGAASRFDVTGMARVAGVCDALAIVRPLAVPVGSTRRPVTVRLEARDPRLRTDVPFSLSLAMPDFAGWVQLDYFSFGDNAVLHVGLSAPRVRQQPTQLPQAIQLSANEQAVLFNGAAGSPGEDMVIATVSRDRLFPQPRPEIEDALTYLAALRAAIAARPAGSVVAHAIPVMIQP